MNKRGRRCHPNLLQQFCAIIFLAPNVMPPEAWKGVVSLSVLAGGTSYALLAGLHLGRLHGSVNVEYRGILVPFMPTAFDSQRSPTL